MEDKGPNNQEKINSKWTKYKITQWLNMAKKIPHKTIQHYCL